MLLHSMGMDAHGFDVFLPDIQSKYRLLALDILDHSGSEKTMEQLSLVENTEIL